MPLGVHGCQGKKGCGSWWGESVDSAGDLGRMVNRVGKLLA